MMRVLRHGLFSLAFAVLFVAVAVLSVHSRANGEAQPQLRAGVAAAEPIQERPTVRATVAPTVVCDEGVSPGGACRVPVTIGVAMPAEAITYEGRALAKQDYLPLLGVPVDQAGSLEVLVDVIDDKECEPVEDFFVMVIGADVRVIIPVYIIDDDC